MIPSHSPNSKLPASWDLFVFPQVWPMHKARIHSFARIFLAVLLCLYMSTRLKAWNCIRWDVCVRACIIICEIPITNPAGSSCTACSAMRSEFGALWRLGLVILWPVHCLFPCGEVSIAFNCVSWNADKTNAYGMQTLNWLVICIAKIYSPFLKRIFFHLSVWFTCLNGIYLLDLVLFKFNSIEMFLTKKLKL